MSEFYDSGRSRECSATTFADDTTGTVPAGNKSLIGKMKSRVSGILPTKISNWFKTTSSTTQNSEDNSLNGSSGNLASVDTANNRSRIELRDDDDDEEEWAGREDEEDGYVNYEEAALADNIAEHDVDDSESQPHSDYAINMLRQQTQTLQKRPGIRARENDDDDEEDDVEGERNTTNSNPFYGKRLSCQPEIKRTRLSNDISIRDSPMVNRQSFIASTPSVGAFMRSSSTAMPSTSASATATRTQFNRYNYMNLYRNQNKREPAYNFGAATTEAALATSGDLPTTTDSNVNLNLNKRNQSSRRNIMIPTSTSSSSEQQQRYNLPNLRRQSLSTVRSSGGNALIGAGAIPGVIREQDATSERNHINNDGQTININNNNNNVKMHSINLLNGDVRVAGVSTDVVSVDTASEASNEEQGHNKDNGSGDRSRTSSFGYSGLNFNAHLQGPKSLFSGTNPPSQGPQQKINNSTMSLNSLHYRRQFNASVYGSTSALSDSRLYNTLSPFYKGHTTYGGASANNSYNKILSGNGGNTDAGTSFLRLKPTIIRPQSSLSMLSSSSNSFTPGSACTGITINASGLATINGEPINISNTAKRILTLLNDFSSPLTEAKKMGDNLKDYQDSLRTNRLKETDLESSRKNRLAQIRSPYLRSSPYQPVKGNVNNSSSTSPAITAPLCKLQIPKVTHFFKMQREMASSSERIRKIAMDQPVNDFFKPCINYKLPVGRDDCDNIVGGKRQNDGNKEQTEKQYQQQQQQPLSQLRQIKQVGKIRHKVSLNARVTSCKNDGRLDETMPPVDLPTLAFPLMQSIPKFDIEFPSTAGAMSSLPSSSTSIQTKNAFVQPSTSLSLKRSLSLKNFKFSPPLPLYMLKKKSSSMHQTAKNFNFSGPSKDKKKKKELTTKNKKKKSKVNNETKNSNDDGRLKSKSCGKVCTPSDASLYTTVTTCPKKDSSVKVPISSSPTTSSSAIEKTTSVTVTTNTLLETSATSNFGNAFKKSTTEWECDICMVRNNEPSEKCVACETPRNVIYASSTPAPSNNNLFNASNSFGSAFKPKANTWECSVCLIVNNSDANKCIACESKRPGGVVTADNNKNVTAESEKPKFQFGFVPAANANQGITTATASPPPLRTPLVGAAPPLTTVVAADDTFKSLVAAQKTSKWSCSACFALNDAVRKICVCCEEPKPGTLVTPDGGLKFNFGNNTSASASVSQFKFGFASNNDDVSVTTTDTAITTTVVSSSSSSTAVPVLSSSSSSVAVPTSFSFGVKPSTTSTSSTSGPATMGSIIKPTSGFIFGFGSSSTSANTKLNDVVVQPTKTVTFNLPTDSPIAAAVPSTTDFKLGSSLPLSSSSLETVKATSGTSATSSTVGFTFTPTSTNSLSSAVVTNSSINATTSTNSGFSFTPLASVASSNSKVAATTTITTSTIQPILTTITTNTESGVGTVTSNAGDASTTVPKTFIFGSFGSETTPASSTVISTPSNSAMPIFAANPVNSSLSTNIADNPAVAAKTNFATASATTVIANLSTNTTSTGNFNFGQPAATSTTPSFIFGSQPAVAVTSTVAKTTASIFGTTTSTINNSFAPYPSNTFIFGGNGESNVLGSIAAPGTGATLTNSANKDTGASTSSNVFGNFGGDKISTTSTTSTFGAPITLAVASTAGTPTTSLFNAGPPASNNQTGFSSSVPPAAGSSSGFATAQNMPVFGGTTPKFGGAAESSNMFGSSSSNNLRTFGGMESISTDAMMQQQPQQQQQAGTFGSFGSSTSSSSAIIAPPPAKQKSFGSFGTTAASIFGNTTEMPKPASFNFNVPNQSTPSTSGIFNFSANSQQPTANNLSNVATLKPAFNFTATAPTVNFNFTGTTINPTSNTDHPYAANRPFVFGNTTTTTMNPGMAMGGTVINTMSSINNINKPASYLSSFGANNGMMEASSNAPFQFNAGAAPTANIFAINPTTSGNPGSQTGAQQARRKIRTPNRRLTPR